MPDETLDEQFEVLDVGGRSWRRRGRNDRELPPIQLDSERPEPPGPTTPTQPTSRQRPSWPQIGIVLGAVALAVVTTTLILDARHQVAAEAAAAETVELIAGEIRDAAGVNSGQTTARLTVSVYNAGPRDVEMLSIHPTGWTLSADDDPNSRRAAAGEWTSIWMKVAPDCDGAPPPRTVEVEVRTEAGDQAVTLDTSGVTSRLRQLRDALCSSEPDHIYMFVEDVELLPADVEGLPMRMFVFADVPDGSGIGDVTSSTPGFDVDVVELPEALSMQEGSPVDVVWSVTDCDQATTFDHAGIELGLDAPQNALPFPDTQLPDAAIAALARYALTFCDA